jgi:hypothetical protein
MYILIISENIYANKALLNYRLCLFDCMLNLLAYGENPPANNDTLKWYKNSSSQPI